MSHSQGDLACWREKRSAPGGLGNRCATQKGGRRYRWLFLPGDLLPRNLVVRSLSAVDALVHDRHVLRQERQQLVEESKILPEPGDLFASDQVIEAREVLAESGQGFLCLADQSLHVVVFARGGQHAPPLAFVFFVSQILRCGPRKGSMNGCAWSGRPTRCGCHGAGAVIAVAT